MPRYKVGTIIDPKLVPALDYFAMLMKNIVQYQLLNRILTNGKKELKETTCSKSTAAPIHDFLDFCEGHLIQNLNIFVIVQSQRYEYFQYVLLLAGIYFFRKGLH